MSRAASPIATLLIACLLTVLLPSRGRAGLLDPTPNPTLRRLYRFRSDDFSQRCYTADPQQRLQFLASDLTPEGVLGQVRVEPAAGTTPLHSLTLANGNGLLTIDALEAQELRNREGATYHGVIGHVYGIQPLGVATRALYRLYSRRTDHHLFTSDPAERDRLIASGYLLYQGGARGAYAYLFHDLSSTRPLFITPIHERASTDGRTLAELRRMKQLLAPDGDGPSVRLGWAKSYWYLRDSGAGPELDHILDLARATPIPLLLILNGGRWMSNDEEAARLDTLRRLGESVPLYRLAWLNRGLYVFHRYTTRPEERAGSIYEGVIAGVYRSRVEGTVPLYRLHFPGIGDRFLTIDEEERSAALRYGAVDEGVVAYVFPEATAETVPLYRLYHPVLGEHFYTTDAQERAAVLARGEFRDEGIACHVHPHPLTSLNQDDIPIFRWGPGGQFVSLSRLNRPHYRQKREALIRAGQRLAAWARENPHLFIGVTIDPETLLNDNPGLGFADYNPAAIEEWRQWLANSGIYDPAAGEYRGQGRQPPLSLPELAAQVGQPYRTWSDVRPPVSANGTRLWQLWRDFCRAMVRHHNQDMADWIVAGGIPRESVFAHQTPDLDPERFGDVPDTAILRTPEGEPLTGGLTAFGGHARRYRLFAHLVSRGVRYWGLFEYNPSDLASPTPVAYEAAMDSLLGLSASDASIIAPYKWPRDEWLPGAAIEGTPFQRALADFIQRYRTVLR